jgi:hypothetical protein
MASPYLPRHIANIPPRLPLDGTNYLVAWEDYRTGSDIYGARVSQSGVVLDTNGIAISTAISGQAFPSIAFDGTNYFVAWTDYRINPSYSDIFGARVNQAGIVLDPNGIGITAVAVLNNQYSPSVAFDETNYLVVWEDYRHGDTSDIYGARVNPAGVVLDSNSFSISTATGDQKSPSVAFDGTNYLVVWVDYRNDSDYADIYGARVNQAGIVLDTSGIVISTGEYYKELPSVVFGDSNYFVVWDGSPGGSFHIHGARVNQAGVVLDTNSIAISNPRFGEWDPSVAFDGTNYFVVWTDELSGMDIYGARVNQAGVVLDTSVNAIAIAPYPQWFPSVAFDGTNYLAVWQDERNGGRIDVYGARVNQAGVVLDSNGIVISTHATWFVYPSVVFDGTNYLVAWENQSDIYGAKVNPLGSVIDTFPVSTQTGSQTTLALAHGAGSQVLITYSGWTDSINYDPVNTMRIWGKFYPFVPAIAEENSKVRIQSTKLLEAYPNPAKSYLAVRLPYNADRQNLKIFDVSGKMVKEIATFPSVFASQSIGTRSALRNDTELKISLKGINQGIYFLRLGKETKKFVVTR